MTALEKYDNHELIEEIIQKEAKVRSLDVEIEQDQRQIHHIKRSRTWKIVKPFMKLKNFFMKRFKTQSHQEQTAYVKSLESYIAKLEHELEEKEEQLDLSLLDKQDLKRQQMMDMLRKRKLDGSLIDYIDRVIAQKSHHMNNYNEVLIYTARLFMNEDEEQRKFIYDKILAALQVEEIPEFIVRQGLSEKQLSLQHVSSFRGSLTKRVRQKQQIGLLPEYLLEDKQKAYQFIDRLGVRRPETIEGDFTAIDVPKKEGTVIKPVDGAGSRGVYLIYDFHDIIDVKRLKKLSSLVELEESMQKDLTMDWVEEDKWMAEELILEDIQKKQPASDIKFYSFYGEVGLILEISRYPERKHCWWTREGKRIRTGKYEEELFHGQGVTEEAIELAEQISAKIPAPFVRIDFLRSNHDLVFGEFTAKPGNYDDFDEQTDKWLGDYYTKAEIRLSHDLLAGKKFTEYHDFMTKQGYHIGKETFIK